MGRKAEGLGEFQHVAVGAQHETFETPQDNLMFMRALGIVIDVCKEVVPETPVSQIAMPVLLPMLVEFIAKNPEYTESAMGPGGAPPLATRASP